MKTIKKSEIVNKLHIVIYLYLTFGWMLSDMSCKLLLFLTPTVMTQWGINHNQCILSQLEMKMIAIERKKEKDEEIKILKKNDSVVLSEDEKEDDKGNLKIEKDESFLRRICNQCGIDISNRGLNIISYLTIYHSFFQSYWRVVL